MAKRREQLEASLGGSTPPTTWQDKFEVGAGSPKKDTEYLRKTYLLEPETVQRIADLAEREDVPLSDLVRFLLSRVLDDVEAGTITIPVKVVGKRRVGR